MQISGCSRLRRREPTQKQGKHSDQGSAEVSRTEMNGAYSQVSVDVIVMHSYSLMCVDWEEGPLIHSQAAFVGLQD